MKVKSLFLVGIVFVFMPICCAAYHIHPAHPYGNTVRSYAENANSYTKASGQYLSDSAITTRVKAALLADRNISSISISVATKNGIVTLTGSVASKFERYKANKIAKNVNGVKKVMNYLVIKKY